MAPLRRGPLAFSLFAFFALLLVCGLTLAGTASAEGEETQASTGPPPTVSFVDEEPLSLEGERLENLIGAGALKVKVHNGSGQAQKVRLEVTGLEEEEPGAEIATLFPEPERVEELEPGETAALELQLAQPKPAPEPGTYTAGLIASGAAGGLARRELTIKYPASEGASASSENSLDPNRPIDITLHAVNYLPSILSSLLGLGVFIGVALLVAAWFFRAWLAEKHRHLPVLVLAAAVLIGVVCLVFAIKDGPWDQPGLHAISSHPIDLSPEVPEGTLGTVSGEDGSIAQLVSKDHKLRPENLDGAEKLTGKYSLEAEHEQAEAAATVNVRDYWIWAVAAIVLGLLIGFLLRRWFQQKRPKMKVWTTLERAVQTYEGELVDVEETDAGKPYAKTTIDQRVYARRREIERLLETGEADKATEKVTALLTYLVRFVEFRERLRKLDAACTELERIPQLDLLNFSLAEANGLQDALALLEAGVDSPALDADEEELKGQLTKVNAQIDLMVATTRSVKASIRHLLSLPETMKQMGSLRNNEPNEFRDIETELFDAVEKKLQASNAEELEKAKADDDTAMRKLSKMTRPEQVGKTGLKVHVVVARDLLPADVDSISRGGAGSALQITYAAPEHAVPAAPVDIEISKSIEGIGKEDDQRIHVDDVVRLTIHFKRALPLSFAEIDIDFGDGSPQRRLRLPTSGQEVFVRHRYKEKGTPVVVVSPVPIGQAQKTADAPAPKRYPLTEIVDEPRALDSEVKLADSETVVTTAAFVLAVASGMGALYFGHASWGQPMDYLAAIVWGGATGEGVKYAAALADRVWPLS